MKELSLAAQSIWAKKSYDGSILWLPLWVHMADSAAVARMLWNKWLSEGVKKAVCAGIMEEGAAEQLFVFLAAAHDLGKATPVFQAKPARPLCPALDDRIAENLIAAGLPMKSHRDFSNANKTPHALASQILLQQAGCNKNAALILGTHHGKPPNNHMLSTSGPESYSFNYHLESKGKAEWTAVQQELIAYTMSLAGFASPEEVPRPNIPGQVLISGLLIMTDWIASNKELFPSIRLEDRWDDLPEDRDATAWEQLGLTGPWVPEDTWLRADIYSQRFDFSTPKPIQRAVTETIRDTSLPGITVIEAPMGGGKTEAALIAAEAFASSANRSGVFFALPTQATSDGIFPRMLDWVNRLDPIYNSIMLAHGKAQFNEEFQGLKFLEGDVNVDHDDTEGLIVHEWFEGQKKSLLADFVVGTIDQLLLSALKQKHVMLRHLGLANKVVIIDECHAYDAYMSQYLDMALRWLGAYNVPVIVLSATLPTEKREAVINAYLSTSKSRKDPLPRDKTSAARQPDWVSNRSYPLITYTSGGDVKQTAVAIDKSESTSVSLASLTGDALVQKLEDLLSNGGCAGVIVNTVKRAQEIARRLREHFGNDIVRLLHSRFIAPDRIDKEQEMLKELGKPDPETHRSPKRPPKRILVGTQVLEQSLDIDFDVMITDLCPMDLLLQRIGRLHRHPRPRKEKLKQAQCLVLGMDEDGFEAGSKGIYGEYLLMRTKALLPEQLNLPQDIPDLVQDVYDETVPLSLEPPGYQQAKKKWDKLIDSKENRADRFRIAPPSTSLRANIAGWLDRDKDVTDRKGEAAVRDSDESIEVLVIRQINNRLYMLGEGSPELFQNTVPDSVLAQNLARQRIRLPNALCGPWIIDQTISQLEQLNAGLLIWQESSWLKGELFLILNENSSARLGGYNLTYDKNDGLLYEKEEVKTDD